MEQQPRDAAPERHRHPGHEAQRERVAALGLLDPPGRVRVVYGAVGRAGHDIWPVNTGLPSTLQLNLISLASAAGQLDDHAVARARRVRELGRGDRGARAAPRPARDQQCFAQQHGAGNDRVAGEMAPRRRVIGLQHALEPHSPAGDLVERARAAACRARCAAGSRRCTADAAGTRRRCAGARRSSGTRRYARGRPRTQPGARPRRLPVRARRTPRRARLRSNSGGS